MARSPSVRARAWRVGERWFIGVRDHGGRLQSMPTNAVSLEEAERLAREIQAGEDDLRRELAAVRFELGSVVS